MSDLPKAILVDLDGTLASSEWRVHLVRGGRRDWEEFFAGMGRDAPVGPLVELLRAVAGDLAVVLLTGRPAEWEEVVRRWLVEHGVPFDELVMRPVGDRRPDFVVKAELLDRLVEPAYEVVLAIDDRPRVIEALRRRGHYVLTAVDPVLRPAERGDG